MSYTQNGSGTEIIEENNYYPFGLKYQGYNQAQGNPSYNYQYNGKELQQETGWNDYGARMYMSDIGRWGVIDPLAEMMRRYSPYNYAYNNPISYIDPDGRKPQAPGEKLEATMMPTTMLMFYASGGSKNNRALIEFVGQSDNIGDFFAAMDKLSLEENEGGGSGITGVSITYNQALALLGLTPGGVDFSQFGVDGSNPMMSLTGIITDWLTKANVKLNGKPGTNEKSIMKFIRKVPELESLYKTSGSFKIIVDLLKEKPVTAPYDAGSNTGTMTFGASSFESYLKLGIDIIHETWHAWDIKNLIYSKIFNFAEEIDSNPSKADEIHKLIIEYRAYDFELNYAPSSINRKGVIFRNAYFDEVINRTNMNPDYFLKKW